MLIFALMLLEVTERKQGKIPASPRKAAFSPKRSALKKVFAKGALNILTKGLIKTYADKSVLVNAISTAYVDIVVDETANPYDEMTVKWLKRSGGISMCTSMIGFPVFASAAGD
ncbi:hypothetical protein [Phyllobacterium sp. SB3]|uniref:hypothetical protein n=1 Tax=Phyllobacterium sp. SB3 TaxID=3156073 RepID=UPI0032AFD1D7